MSSSLSPLSQRTTLRRATTAGLIGNVMEWYDFAVYGYFAAVIGPQFFPTDEPSLSLIAAFGAFAAGFLVRPLGGLLFGRIGDRIGRERAMVLSVITMAVPTVLMGLLPTYPEIGLAAPILMVLLRIVQGLSVGGEYTSSLVYLAEASEPEKRAQRAIWGAWGATAGTLLGSGVGALIASSMSEATLTAWGWRLPFLLGGCVAITGYFLRRGLRNRQPVHTSRQPVREVFGSQRMKVLRIALLNGSMGVGFYMAFVYVVTYIKEVNHMSESVALQLNTASMAILLLLLPFTARLSDRVGRRPLIVAGNLLLLLGAMPFFQMIHQGSMLSIFLAELGFVIGVALVAGGLVAANVELLPMSIRCTGLALGYNLAIGLLGGTTPLVATWLIASSGDPIAPAYWVMVTAMVALGVALFWMPETATRLVGGEALRVSIAPYTLKDLNSVSLPHNRSLQASRPTDLTPETPARRPLGDHLPGRPVRDAPVGRPSGETPSNQPFREAPPPPSMDVPEPPVDPMAPTVPAST